MAECVRHLVEGLLHKAGLRPVRLPIEAGPRDPHVRILASENLLTAKRVIYYTGHEAQDLGIFAYRTAHEKSLTSGSMHDFAEAVIDTDTALVAASPGQLVWHRGGRRCMSLRSWDTLPRKTGVSAGYRMDPIKNRVPGHETPDAHLISVLNYILHVARPHAMIDIIGLGDGARALIMHLDNHWKDVQSRIQGVCLGLIYPWNIEEVVQTEDFRQFWALYARAYLVHDESLDAPLAGRQSIGCNCYSSGESLLLECMMPQIYLSISEFFQKVDANYKEPVTELDSLLDRSRRVVDWIDGQGQAPPTFSIIDEEDIHFVAPQEQLDSNKASR